MPTRLEGLARDSGLKEVSQWTEVKGRDAIYRKFEFKDFKEAWAFMSKVAEVADKVIISQLDFFLGD